MHNAYIFQNGIYTYLHTTLKSTIFKLLKNNVLLFIKNKYKCENVNCDEVNICE